MTYKNPWVTVLIAIFVAISTVSASAVHAQNQPIADSAIANWTNPGEFPLEGDLTAGRGELSSSDVYRLYDDTLTLDQFAIAVDQFERGLGEERYLQDGEIIQVSFTVNGDHRKRTLRVMFGDEVPEDDPKRRSMVYDTGRLDGVKLVLPDVCGNWSIMTLRDPEPPQVVVKNERSYELICWDKANNGHIHGNGGSLLSGVEISVCYDSHEHVPALLLESTSIQSRGQGQNCGWVYQ